MTQIPPDIPGTNISPEVLGPSFPLIPTERSLVVTSRTQLLSLFPLLLTNGNDAVRMGYCPRIYYPNLHCNRFLPSRMLSSAGHLALHTARQNALCKAQTRRDSRNASNDNDAFDLAKTHVAPLEGKRDIGRSPSFSDCQFLLICWP